jgi:hypothetical protein
MLTFGESIGTLTKNDLLSAELLKDWPWVEGIWSRVGPAAMRQREKDGEPRLYEDYSATTSITSYTPDRCSFSTNAERSATRLVSCASASARQRR